MPIRRLLEGARLSQCVISNGTLYMSGQIARDPTEDFEDQVRQVLAAIDERLADAGIDRTHVVSAMIWLDDYRNWARLNSVWDLWVVEGHKPTRSCVEAKLARPEYQIEIAVIASVER